ncbi:MAG TPA: ABC transporter permease [Kofleriaceae bacterium]|nr:ABC transporter permease [Kofleriaceae bacterium]
MPIGAFILRRLGLGLISILGVSVLVFFFIHLIPGDPITHLAGGDQATADQRRVIAHCLGLDRSLPGQFADFLRRVGDLTLGHQCPDPGSKPTVMALIAHAFPSTMILAVAGMAVAIALALPLGIIAAVRRGTWMDTLAAIVSLSGIAVPIMLLGPLLLLWFFLDLGWLPGPAETGGAALVLPAFAVGTHLMALLARMTRSSMVEVLGEDYLRTARAKGLRELTVVGKHALRNALLPVITIAGLQFGSMLSGAIITEKVFSRPGLGTLLVTAIGERNYPVIQGTVLVIATIYVLVNLMVDVAYGIADPRIRRA